MQTPQKSLSLRPLRYDTTVVATAPPPSVVVPNPVIWSSLIWLDFDILDIFPTYILLLVLKLASKRLGLRVANRWYTTWSQCVKEICGKALRLTSPQIEHVLIWCKTPQNATDLKSFRIIKDHHYFLDDVTLFQNHCHQSCQAFMQQFYSEMKNMYLNHSWAIRIQIISQILCNCQVCLDSHSSYINWWANTLKFLIVKLKNTDPLTTVQYSAEEPSLHAHVDWQKPLTQSPLYVKNLPSPHGNSTL